MMAFKVGNVLTKNRQYALMKKSAKSVRVLDENDFPSEAEALEFVKQTLGEVKLSSIVVDGKRSDRTYVANLGDANILITIRLFPRFARIVKAVMEVK